MDIKEIRNVSVPYDSPIDVIFKNTIDNMASAFSKSMDDGIMTAVVKAGFDVDREKLEQALTQDKSRYEEAYRKGYAAGYKRREDENIRCRDCKHRPEEPEGGADNGSDYIFPDSICPCQCEGDTWYSWRPADSWYCPKGELKEGRDK